VVEVFCKNVVDIYFQKRTVVLLMERCKLLHSGNAMILWS
jgi:hypothetical protein